jgi:metal-responsive CopG/Arc/MetJ family transcriptional regulator
MNTENTTTPIDDSEAWENGTLGQSLEHAAVSTVDPKTIDDALGIELVSFRLNKDIVEALDDLARLNNSSRNALIQEAVAHFVCHNEPHEDIETMLYAAFKKIATYQHDNYESQLESVNKFLTFLNDVEAWATASSTDNTEDDSDVNIEVLGLGDTIRTIRLDLNGSKGGELSIGRKANMDVNPSRLILLESAFAQIQKIYDMVTGNDGVSLLRSGIELLRLLLADIVLNSDNRYRFIVEKVTSVVGWDLANLNLPDHELKRVHDHALELHVYPIDLVINALAANT